MPSTVRSILAVVAGFVVIGILAYGTGVALAGTWPGSHDADGYPATNAARLVQLAYVGVFATFGCWLAGRMAPNGPMKHALAVGVLGLILNVTSALAVWDRHPAWYLVIGILTTMLWAWLGGRLAETRAAASLRAPA